MDKINPNSRKTTKLELATLFNNTIDKIDVINSFYKTLREGSDESKSLEAVQNDLKELYKNFFNGSPNKKEALTSIHQEIIDYKKELLEGDTSIKSNIESFQEEITNLYEKCFSENNENIEKQIDDYFSKIKEFYNEWFNEDKSKSTILNSWFSEFEKKYNDLFKIEDGTEISRINQVYKNIDTIKEFIKEIDTQKKSFSNTEKSLEEIKKDINQKQKEVNALLGDATVKTLTQGYIEAKKEYAKKDYSKLNNSKNTKTAKTIQLLKNLFIFLTRDLYSLFYYTLFILPILLVVSVFILSYSTDKGFQIVNYSTSLGLDFILYKISISLPLLWISWFAQNSIKERKRLFEEYNHKLRVVQMYQIFSSQQNQSFKLNENSKMEKLLLDTIGYNPIDKSHLKNDSFVEKFIAKIEKKNRQKSEDSSLE